MKKHNEDELRKEYSADELGKGKRGKHYKAYMKGTNLVKLAPDVAAKFRSDEDVNKALKWLIKHDLIATVTK